MIPEPFTYIVAGFGILATLVNLVAGTLEGLKHRKDEFSGYSEKMGEIGEGLELCQLRLAACLESWRNDQQALMDEQDCLELFGTENARFLKNLLTRIVKALLEAQQEMRDGLRRIDPSTNARASAGECFIGDEKQLQADQAYCEAYAWISGVDRNNVFTASPRRKWKAQAEDLLEPSWKFLIKLEYTVWNGKAIRARLESLESAIKRVKDFTEFLSDQVRDLSIDGTENTFSERLSRTVRLNKDWRKFSAVMGAVAQVPFNVIPRKPDGEGHIDCFRSDNDLTTSVLVEERDNQDRLQKRNVVYIAYSKASTIPEEGLVEEVRCGQCRAPLSRVETPCPRSEGRNMRRLYQDVSSMPVDAQDEWQSLWLAERAEIVLALVTWVILLWMTPWTRCVSTDHLWRYPSNEGRAQFSIRPIGQSCAHNHGCHSRFAGPTGREALCAEDGDVTNPSAGQEPRKEYFRRTPTAEEVSKARSSLVTLGVTLSEIALIMPCQVRLGPKQTLIFVAGGREYGEAELLDAVQTKMGIPYRRAVERCFLTWRSPFCRMTTATDLVHFSREVLERLCRWEKDLVRPHQALEVERSWRPNAQTTPELVRSGAA